MAGITPVTFLKDTFKRTGRSSICPFRLTKSRFISLASSVGNDIFRFVFVRFEFENTVSINLLHSDGTQSRFSSLGPTSSSPYSHH